MIIRGPKHAARVVAASEQILREGFREGQRVLAGQFREAARRRREQFAQWLLRDVHLKDVSFGDHTIKLSPSGVGDVARWSASQAAVAAGDIGMDATNGFVRCFVNGASKDIPVGRYQEYYRTTGTTPVERWWPANANTCTALVTNIFAPDTLYAMPFFSPRGGTLDRIGFNVTTAGAAGSNARCGIYDSTSDVNLYPNTLIQDGGDQTTNTTGVKSTNIAVTLDQQKLYWFAYVSDNTATEPQIRATPLAAMYPALGGTSGFGGAMAYGWEVAFTYAALPTPYPAAATLSSAGPGPYIAVRYSA